MGGCQTFVSQSAGHRNDRPTSISISNLPTNQPQTSSLLLHVWSTQPLLAWKSPPTGGHSPAPNWCRPGPRQLQCVHPRSKQVQLQAWFFSPRLLTILGSLTYFYAHTSSSHLHPPLPLSSCPAVLSGNPHHMLNILLPPTSLFHF